MCKRLCHLLCAGISKSTFNDISKNKHLHWYCNVCSPIAENVLESLSDLKEQYSDLKEQYSNILSRVETLEKEKDEARPTASNVSVETAVKRAVTATIEEMNDIKRRERNVVVFGIQENQGTDPDSDRTKIKDILRAVGVVAQDCIIDCHRLGKPGGDKPRVLRVRLTTTDIKHELLRVAKTLKEKGFPSVYIKPDLTPRQLEEHRELVNQMKAANAVTRTVRIYRGKLVPLDLRAVTAPLAGQ
jgi:hypothetical protein